MKNTEVEEIHYLSALVGQLGRSNNSRSHFKKILCCSFTNVTPITNFTQIGLKIQKFKFLKFLKHIKDSFTTDGPTGMKDASRKVIISYFSYFIFFHSVTFSYLLMVFMFYWDRLQFYFAQRGILV